MKKQGEKRRRGARFQKLLAGSVILTGLVRFFNALSSSLFKTPFHRLLADTEELSGEFRSRTALIEEVQRDNRLHRRFYNSPPMRLLRLLASAFVQTSPRAYATYFLGFGGVIILAFLGEFFKLYTLSVSIYHMIAGFVLCLLSVPLCVAGEPLCIVTQRNRFFSFLLYDFFGLRRSAGIRNGAKIPALLLLFLGLLSGVIGAFFSPFLVLFVLFALLFAGLVTYSPEFGLIFLVLVLPFLGLTGHAGAYAAAISLLCVLSYIQKVLVGKRVFEFRPLDLLVLLFAVFYLFGGVFTGGGLPSFFTALIGFFAILIYFVAENLLTNELAVRRFLSVFMLSAFFVAAIGVLDVVNAAVEPAWLDRAVFASIERRITSVFGNPNILSAYLLLALPFAIVRLFSSRGFFEGLWRFLVTASLLSALVLTFSRGAWIALGAVLLFSLLFCARRSRLFVFLVTVTLPVLGIALPQSVLSRFYSIGLRADTSILHRRMIWRGSLSMLRDFGFGGVGVGEEAFTRFYSLYAVAGAESAPHTHSLYLQLFAELGIFGILIFLGVLIIFFQSSYTHMYKTPKYPEMGIGIAAIAAVLAVLINGLFDHVFYDRRILLLFFLVMGLGSALRHLGTRKAEYTEWQGIDMSGAAIDVNL